NENANIAQLAFVTSVVGRASYRSHRQEAGQHPFRNNSKSRLRRHGTGTRRQDLTARRRNHLKTIQSPYFQETLAILQLPHSCSSAENHQASKWSWSQNCYKLKNSWQYFCIPLVSTIPTDKLKIASSTQAKQYHPTCTQTSVPRRHFFDKCLGALNSVHIPASIQAHKTAPYQNRKGFLSQNVVGVCDFGMQFMYMRVGWEGTAHDAWSKDFKIRQGFFYLADAFCKTIMTQASEYQLEQQYDLVLACACLHNINIGKNRYYDIIFDESLAMAEQYKAIYTKDPPPPPEPEYSSEHKRQHCKKWRDSIAEGLWTQFVSLVIAGNPRKQKMEMKKAPEERREKDQE
ncbi:hypothetical protein MJO28_003634, partial [Puccinia striiformis f. sp. tritici]